MKKYPVLENDRFVNYPGELSHSFFWQSLSMYILSLHNRMRGNPDEHVRLEQFLNSSFETDSQRVNGVLKSTSHLRVTWIGHASFLIQIGDFSVLTDPVFGDLSFLFKRIQEPGIALTCLPSIDAVVISHNHRDHLDEQSIRAIFTRNPACHFYVPYGDKAWFLKRGITQVTECMWWDHEVLRIGTTDLTIHFLPAHHWSQRGLFDRNKSLWGSWLIQTAGKAVYFAGDTAYSTHFKQIAHEFGSIDLALMPIGPCEPYKWMKHSHMNAEESGRAFIDLQARIFIPMHWGTYRFGVDSLFAPLDRITSWWQMHHAQLGDSQLITPAWGKSVVIDQVNAAITSNQQDTSETVSY